MNRLQFFLLMIAFVPFFVNGSTAQKQQTPVEKHGFLSVKEGKMVNQLGVPPQLRGISFSWSIWQGAKYYNKEVVNWLVDDFKVDLIRLSMAIEPDSGYLQFPEKQRDKMIELIDQGIKRGIYVIIDWHDHHASKNKKESKDFFQEMAKRYHQVPNVIYEIWNEPERQPWSEIKDYSEEIVAAIRKYDKKNLIVIGSSQWDQDVDVAAENPITSFENLVYSFHFYASDSWHQEKLRAKAEKAMELGLPLFVTEWGVGEANGDGIFDLEKTNRWMEWMEKHQLSWANWNITDKEETTALLKPKASVKGKWDTSVLTPAGNYIRDVLRKLNLR